MPKYLKYGIIFGIVDFACLTVSEAYDYYSGKVELIKIAIPSVSLMIFVVSYFVLKRRKC